MKEKEKNVLRIDSKKFNKKISFLEDEKEGDEIIIKGAIKKSSLKGVHEYLKGSEDESDDVDEVVE